MMTLTDIKNYLIIYKDITGELPLVVTCVFTQILSGKSVALEATVTENHLYYYVFLEQELTLAGQLKMEVQVSGKTIYQEVIKKK